MSLCELFVSTRSQMKMAFVRFYNTQVTLSNGGKTGVTVPITKQLVHLPPTVDASFDAGGGNGYSAANQGAEVNDLITNRQPVLHR